MAITTQLNLVQGRQGPTDPRKSFGKSSAKIQQTHRKSAGKLPQNFHTLRSQRRPSPRGGSGKSPVRSPQNSCQSLVEAPQNLGKRPAFSGHRPNSQGLLGSQCSSGWLREVMLSFQPFPGMRSCTPTCPPEKTRLTNSIKGRCNIREVVIESFCCTQ